MHEHGTKTTPVFLPADGEASVTTSKFGLLTIRQHSATRRHIFPYPQGVHLPKPVSTDLTLKPDSVLTNPIGKDGVRSWSM